MSAKEFDLWHRPWVPVTIASGGVAEPALLGFGELLKRAHEVTALSIGAAPAESALLRVLVALAARVTGLDIASKGKTAWEDVQDEALAAGRFDPKAVDRYFEKYPDRWDLFHQSRPWMQDPRLATECDKTVGVGKLTIGRPAGNNHAWFGHDVDAKARPSSVTEAVASMLVWLYYGASGKCAARRIGSAKVSNSLAGPLRSKLSYFPWGNNLFTTLMASIPFPQDDDGSPDLCPWEKGELPDPAAVPVARRGAMGRLTDRAQHAVLLKAADGQIVDAWITVSTKHPIVAGDDPYTIYQQSQAGNRYQRYANSGRALWRDVDTLLTARTTGANDASRPSVFATATQLRGVDLRVRALGFEQDGQAKDEQFVVGTTPVILHLADNRDDSGIAGRIGDLRSAGEAVGARLDRAVKNAWANLVGGKPENCAWAVEAGLAYWPKAEAEFWRCVNQREFENTFVAYLRIAAGIFDDITGRLPSARGVKAAESARIWLYGGPRPNRR